MPMYLKRKNVTKDLKPEGYVGTIEMTEAIIEKLH